jgi:hypothetical protein
MKTKLFIKIIKTMEKPDQRSPITGNEGGPIELELAASWTANYRDRHPRETISQFFGQVILNRILQQDGCLGIRIYYANRQPLNGWQRFFVAIGNFFIKTVANAVGEQRFVIAGVLATGEDILPGGNNKTVASSNVVHTFKLEQSVIGDQSFPCPGSTGCPKNALTEAK